MNVDSLYMEPTVFPPKLKYCTEQVCRTLLNTMFKTHCFCYSEFCCLNESSLFVCSSYPLTLLLPCSWLAEMAPVFRQLLKSHMYSCHVNSIVTRGCQILWLLLLSVVLFCSLHTLLITYSVNVICLCKNNLGNANSHMMMRILIAVQAIVKAHLSFLHHCCLVPWCHFLIDAGQEVLGNSQSILQERVVWVAAWSVLQ